MDTAAFVPVRPKSTSSTSRRRRRVVKVTVLSLSDIHVCLPPLEPIEPVVGQEESGGAHNSPSANHISKTENTCTISAENNGQLIATADGGSATGTNNPTSPRLPQHLQPYWDDVVGLGFAADIELQQKQQRRTNYNRNLSLSAAVTFSGSCPHQHMHVLSSSLCSRTGRMMVESDPMLCHGEDLSDHSLYSKTHTLDGKVTCTHVFMAKWDDDESSSADKTISGSADPVPSDRSAGEDSSSVRVDAFKISDNWRRRRAASFRRMGSNSASSQPHMMASLQHWQNDGATALQKQTISSLKNGDIDERKAMPNVDEEKEDSEEAAKGPGVKTTAIGEPDVLAKGTKVSTKRLLPGLCKTDESSSLSPKSSLVPKNDLDLPAMIADLPITIETPCSSPSNEKERSFLPHMSAPVSSFEPSLPCADDLPDIIELNIELIVRRDLASIVDGDSGGTLEPLHDFQGEKILNPVGGVAHLVVFEDDVNSDGLRIVDLPVRQKSFPSTRTDVDVSDSKPHLGNVSYPIVEIGKDALLSVRVEIEPSEDGKDGDEEEVDSSIQWSHSGATAAVAAGKEEAGIAKLTDIDPDAPDADTNTDFPATDGATGGKAVASGEDPIPRTGIFCGLSDVVGTWDLAKKCFVICVDHCDDDALVYVNDGDDGRSLASTIDTL